jgi:hypothetical protein
VEDQKAEGSGERAVRGEGGLALAVAVIGGGGDSMIAHSVGGNGGGDEALADVSWR